MPGSRTCAARGPKASSASSADMPEREKRSMSQASKAGLSGPTRLQSGNAVLALENLRPRPQSTPETKQSRSASDSIWKPVVFSAGVSLPSVTQVVARA